MRYMVINNQNIVVNAIEWDGQSEWQPPQGCYVIPSEYAGIGDLYNRDKNTFTRAVIIEN